MKTSKFVKINDTNCNKLAEKLVEKVKNEGKFWEKAENVEHPLKFRSESIEEITQWLFFIDTCNFSYWQDPVDGEIKSVYRVVGLGFYKSLFFHLFYNI